MTKRSCIVGCLFAFVVTIFFGYTSYVCYNDKHWLYIPMGFLALSMIIAFIRFLDDYRYITGRFTPKELDNSRFLNF